MAEQAAPADASSEDINDFMDSAFDQLEAGEAVEGGTDISEDDIAAVVDAETGTDDQDAEPVEATSDTDDPTEDSADEAEEASEPGDSPTVAAPQSMSAKDREAFAALPPESQKWLADRAKEQEAAFTQKTMDLADKSKSLDKLDQVLAPRRQQLAMDGMDDGTAVGQLFALSDFANSDPIGFVKYLFDQRQIPLSALTESGRPNTPADPQLAAMQAKMQGFESFLTQQQAQAQRQAESVIGSDVAKFAEANEFYSEVENEMIPVVAALRQNDPSLSNADLLAKAYKMAVAANEGVSAKVEAARAAKAEVDKLAMAKARAAKAKKAAGSNVRQSGARPAGKAGATSVDDFIGGLVEERMTA